MKEATDVVNGRDSSDIIELGTTLPLLSEPVSSTRPAFKEPMIYSSTNPARLAISPPVHRSLSYSAVLPTLAVFILTTGLGVGVLLWLFLKRKIPALQAFQDGYLLVDEGTTRSNGDIESATLRALTATSFIAHIISATSPILMSLIAYRIAYLWITERMNRADDSNAGLTPLQYGLMIQVLSASSIMSLYDATKYLFQKSRRVKVPVYFTTAVTMGLGVYFITHLIGIADLWLHATTTAVLYNMTTTPTDPELFQTSLQFNQSLCTTLDFPPASHTCMSSQDGWGNTELIRAGLAMVSNSSVDRVTITLAESNDLAVTVPLSFDRLSRFQSRTFGMRARCESLKSKCQPSSYAYSANCSNIGVTAIPTSGNLARNAVLVSPPHQFNGSQLSNDGSIIFGISECCTSNPVQSILQLRWSSPEDTNRIFPNNVVDIYPIPSISIYASCSIEVLNVTLRYDGARSDQFWSLVPEETILSEPAFATALISPYSWQLVNDWLATNVRSRALFADTDEKALAALNQELGRLALGYVSGAFILVPGMDVEIIIPSILGRYPLAPIFVFVGLLLVYGFIALAVFIICFGATAPQIHVPAELRTGSQSKEVSELELARTRLLSPLPIIAQHFSEYAFVSPGPDEPDSLSVRTSAVEMFSEYRSGRKRKGRVWLGLEANSERPRYGVWNGE
ncbi:hypothetical protein RhiJN_25186 [Ceratobasidium sp. AG-Ba]|nr:hypothetical protein RhiJN_25186 [Ceratobasidium sp. AG-Ba]